MRLSRDAFSNGSAGSESKSSPSGFQPVGGVEHVDAVKLQVHERRSVTLEPRRRTIAQPRMHRDLALLCAVCLGCTSTTRLSPPAAAPTPPAAGDVASSFRGAPVPSSRELVSPFARVCERVDREQKALVLRERRRAALELPGKGTTELPPVSSSLDPIGACEPSGARGAWSFEASDLSLSTAEAYPSWRAHLSLVHYDRHFRRAVQAFTECCGEMYDGELQNDRPVLFDYDGDGEAEVYVHATEYEKSVAAGGQEWAVVYAFKDGAIVPYAPASNLDLFGKLTDADGDGRPDLHSHANINVASGPADACREELQQYAPDFLVHSLSDGRFSRTDDVARAYARKWCPARPAVIAGVEDAGCARLWANTPQKLESERARVAASCVEVDRAKCESGAHAPNEVFECHLRSDAFAAEPPFTLP
jgi:hypothetical protein